MQFSNSVPGPTPLVFLSLFSPSAADPWPVDFLNYFHKLAEIFFGIWFFTRVVDTGDNLVSSKWCCWQQQHTSGSFIQSRLFLPVSLSPPSKNWLLKSEKHGTNICFLTTTANLSPVSTFLAMYLGNISSFLGKNQKNNKLCWCVTNL